MKYFYFFIFLFLVGKSYSQVDPTNYIKTDLMAGSPNAASLTRVADIPVTLYTGLPNVSIPIYNLKGKELSVPVSIVYNYDGFRPMADASWVGLGWSLQAGGIITRQVKDKVDEEGASAGTFDTITNILQQANESQDFLMQVAKYAVVDSEPDIYTFSFGGYSGKFVKVKGKFYVFPNQKIKITGGPMGDFIITIPDGTIYTFSAFEFSTPRGNSGANYNIPTHKSAWYLTKIENASKTDVILLDYSQEGQINKDGPITQTYKYVHPFQGDNTGDYAQSSTLFNKKGVFPTFVSGLRLNSISTFNTTIYFIPAEEARLDINQGISGNSKALNSIVVVNAIGEEVKRLKFWQRYTPSSGYNGRVMFLDSISEYRMSGTDRTQLTHSFEYHDIPGFATKSGAAVDHWGYYRGQGDFGPNLLPAGYVPNAVINRDPHFPGTVAGALKKIVYPTGGNTSFVYEPNRQYTGDHYIQIAQNVNAHISGSTTSTLTSVEEFFTVEYDQEIDVNLIRGVPNPFVDNHARNLSKDFTIKKVGSSFEYQGQIDLESDNSGKNFKVFLTAGTYYITTTIDLRESSMTAEVYHYKNGNPVPGKIVGGLRLNSLINQPAFGPEIKKQFTYTNAEGFCSGMSFTRPLYDSTLFTDIVEALDKRSVINSTIYNSSISETHGIGTPHYYNVVREEIISSELNLVTEYGYESFQSEGNFMGIEPSYTKVFKNNGEELELVSETKFEYVEKTDTMIHAIKPYLRSKVIPAGAMYEVDETYDFTSYYLRQMWVGPIKKTEKLYQNTGVIENVTEYHYDNSIYRNLNLIKTTDSKGNIHTQKIKFAEDYTNLINEDLIDAFVLIPIEEQVWKHENLNDSMLISGKITEFNELFKPHKIYSLEIPEGIAALDNELIASGKFSTLLSDSRYKPQVEFEYDMEANIIWQQAENNMKISYLWDDFNSYPFAEIINANPDDVAICGFESDVYQGNWNYSGLNILNPEAITGKFVYNLSGGNIVKNDLVSSKEYFLFYWSKSPLLVNVTGSSGAVISSPETVYVKDSWTLIKRVISNATSIQIQGSSIIDDIKLFPSNSQVRTFTFKPDVGPTSESATNGQITYFEYDSFGRLTLIKDMEGNILKRICYNYNGQVTDCGNLIDINPIWEPTGLNRCAPCDLNPIYLSGQEEIQEIDNNIYSPGYLQLRWVNSGPSSQCSTQVWENTTVPIRCKQDINFENTGEQEQQQEDVNPCSSTYGYKRWVVVGTNLNACPLPPECDSNNCYLEGYKCVKGICEEGIKVYTMGHYDMESGGWICYYYYEFSDGSWSPTYWEQSPYSCMFP